MDHITAEEAEKMIEGGGVTIVDVRTREEYQMGHIPNAINIRNETITSPPKELPDKDATILLYCKSGLRAEDAMMKLEEMGYTHLIHMGGILDWKGPIVKDLS